MRTPTPRPAIPAAARIIHRENASVYPRRGKHCCVVASGSPQILLLLEHRLLECPVMPRSAVHSLRRGGKHQFSDRRSMPFPMAINAIQQPPREVVPLDQHHGRVDQLHHVIELSPPITTSKSRTACGGEEKRLKKKREKGYFLARPLR